MKTLQGLIKNTHFLLNWYDISLNSTKSDFIDPFSIIVILALLKYKPIGTKIHIGKSVIQLDEPKFAQSIVRTLHRNRKEDLKRIYHPLIYACKYFLNPDRDSSQVEDHTTQSLFDIQDVFLFSVAGLRNLKQTYKGYDDVVNMINVYINIIERSINEYDSIMSFLDDLLKLSEPISLVSQENSSLKNMIEMKKNIYDQFNRIWSDTRLAIVTHMFKELDTKIDSERTNITQSITSVLSDCNQDIQNLLKNLSE